MTKFLDPRAIELTIVEIATIDSLCDEIAWHMSRET
jgi:hypothetical protein